VMLDAIVRLSRRTGHLAWVVDRFIVGSRIQWQRKMR